MDFENILITGSSGMIGSSINFGFQPTSSEMNICDMHSINNYLSKIQKISGIIHLAASNLRESEEYHNKAIQTNIIGTANIVEIAKKYNVKFILVSSGAVFSSHTSPDIIFDETNIPNPNCMYGLTKHASEKLALLYDKTVIVRTGWLFAGDQKLHQKFVELAINNLQLNTEVRASTNFYGSPTYLFDFVEQLKKIISNYSYYKIHHVVNSEYASGYEIASEIAKIMNKPQTLIKTVKSSEVPNPGPLNRSLTEKLTSIHNFNILRSWKEALHEYIIKKLNIIENPQKIILDNKLSIYYNRDKCRLCNSSNLKIFYKMVPTALANHLVKKPINQEIIPLDLCICENCCHVQLIQSIDPTCQYSNYSYVSSTSTTMTKHLENSSLRFVRELNLDKLDNILEIGANDGVCIKHLINNNYINVIGVDPAENIHERHNLPIICDFFGKNILSTINKKFKLIFGFHCCAHIEDIQDVWNTVDKLLDNDGVFIMEVGYFFTIFQKKYFDIVYHEHIDYWLVTSIQPFAKKYGLTLYKVNINEIQGGSIQFYFSKDPTIKVETSVFEYLEKEQILFNNNNLVKWKNNVILNGKDIYNILTSFVNCGKTIVGYGASAKLTTFLYQFNLSDKTIKYIIDDSIYKQYHYTPGLHIPIVPIDILDTEKVDYIIIFCWNFADEVIKKLSKYRENGLRIIIPFPEIKII